MDKPRVYGETDYAEIRKRDWSRIHIEGDRNEPLHILPRLGRWLSPQKRSK